MIGLIFALPAYLPPATTPQSLHATRSSPVFVPPAPAATGEVYGCLNPLLIACDCWEMTPDLASASAAAAAQPSCSCSRR